MRLISVCLLLVGMIAGVSSINVVSHRRHQTHALEMVSSDATVSDPRHDAIRTAFCTNWGPVLARIDNGFVLMKTSNDRAKLVDIFWLTVRKPEVPECTHKMVPTPGCPGAGSNVCVLDGGVVALGEAHIHFANYDKDNGHRADLRLSLKDTCLAADADYHHPAADFRRQPATPRNMNFNAQNTCNKQGDHKYMRETVRGWNAMFG